MTATALERLRSDIRASARRILQPPSLLNVWQWADANRVLSADAGAAEPGQWRTDRVPYLREIMESLTDPDVVRVVLMKSSQVGGTEVANNWIGYSIDADPAPMLMLYPTDEALKLWSTIKLDAMLRSSPALQGKVYDAAEGRRDKRNTIRRKLFMGGSLVGLAARSSSQLRSLVAPRAIADEIDEYLPDVNKQGDPLELLERALRTFIRVGLAKMLIVSTPTDEETSRIVREYAKTDQRVHLLPCPQCNHEQPLFWQDEGKYRFLFEREGEGRDAHIVPGSTRYACRACEHLIEQRWKLDMLAAGRWQPQRPVRENRGYHIWSAYSPFVSWDTITQKFLDSKDVPADRKTFDNLWLGRAYQESGQRTSPSALEARAEPYGAGVDVPDGVGLLTCALDVQGDRVEYCVWGWGEGQESWVIHWDRIDGDPGDDATFDRAGEEIFSPWRHAMGGAAQVQLLVVDASYLPESVWRFCERWSARGFRVIPVMGRQGRGRPLMQRPTAQRAKRTRRRTRPTWLMGTDAVKDDLLLSRLKIAAAGPFYVHFPDTLDPAFYDQLVAEELRTVYVRRRPERRWMLIPDRRNEALDLACMNLAALHELGPAVMRNLGALAEQLRHASPATDAPASAAPTARHVISTGVSW